MLEAKVEARLKTRLQANGFKVLKLTCPGTSGVPDRMILPPAGSGLRTIEFVELKRPGGAARPLQVAVHHDWRRRGQNITVLSTYAEVDEFCAKLIARLELPKWAGI